ncbi:hypothetical protein [Effusibacillus dendaii]|uniref:Uncharacterized protein n=1 Tax=Effusibacillus dendaii TaxID=2743772 RepID=A0A7I8DGP7_9BACL|nr:hypothetical protein [Effusibacillus dendaii]BCJ88522.1 hypothetical protein skT53_35070 [Effusibacillus dendaii]
MKDSTNVIGANQCDDGNPDRNPDGNEVSLQIVERPDPANNRTDWTFSPGTASSLSADSTVQWNELYANKNHTSIGIAGPDMDKQFLLQIGNSMNVYTPVDGQAVKIPLQLEEALFLPEQIEHYTGIPMKFQSYKIEDVQNGVYLNGVITHSGYQFFTLYSKVDWDNAQTIQAQLDAETIKVYVNEQKAGSQDPAKEHVVYTIKTVERSIRYEVYRNNVLEKTAPIVYGIE